MKASLVRDSFALVGLALLTYGVGMVHMPAALIVLGSILLLSALWGHFHGIPEGAPRQE